MMNYDISQPVPQRSDRAQEEEIAASQQSPISSSEFAQYMKRNLEIANQM